MPDYTKEILASDYDDGTMPANVAQFGATVIGRKIVSAEQNGDGEGSLIITLDDGTNVKLVATSDCCAYTSMEKFLLHPEMVDHAITGVGTTGSYTTWHIYADMGDVLELEVEWSCGNPFYYAYGFNIVVENVSA
jgi:hypothetical protein